MKKFSLVILVTSLPFISTLSYAYSGANKVEMYTPTLTISGSNYESKNTGNAKNFSAIDVQSGLINISQKFSAWADIDVNKFTAEDYNTIATAYNEGTATNGSVIYTSAGILNLTQLQSLKQKIKIDKARIKTNRAKFKSTNSGNADNGSSIDVKSGAINISQ